MSQELGMTRTSFHMMGLLLMDNMMARLDGLLEALNRKWTV